MLSQTFLSLAHSRSVLFHFMRTNGSYNLSDGIRLVQTCHLIDTSSHSRASREITTCSSGKTFGTISSQQRLFRFKVVSKQFQQTRAFKSISMTNQPIVAIPEQSTNQTDACVAKSKLHTTISTTTNGIAKNNNDEVQGSLLVVGSQYTIAKAPNFRTMAGIHRLVMEPTREHIENIRNDLRKIKAKNNEDQQITLDKDPVSGIATVCIRSAAKNGISGKMMCDFLDVVDELHGWDEGKGVMIYGHQGFFCSGN